MRPGYAAEDGAALHFVGSELAGSSPRGPRRAATASTRSGERVVEMRIATAYLGDAGAPPRRPPLPRGDARRGRQAAAMITRDPRPRRPRFHLAPARTARSAS